MEIKNTQNVATLSNNVFDRDTLSKSEFNEMVENFITTVAVLTKNKRDINEYSSWNLNNIIDMIEFGLIEDESEITLLKKDLKKDLFDQLLVTINLVSTYNLLDYPEVAKYNRVYRENLVKKEIESNKPTLVDLFCGAGGLSLGFTQEEFRVVFANDIDKAALRTYSFNHPEIDGERITIGGIEDIAHNVRQYISETVDVIVGGPPCQGFSTANRQRVIDDPRNVLYKYYVESVQNLLPKFFIMENVKGMRNVADQVVEDFNSSLSVGYDVSFEVFNARKFGIPQNRERLIYIGVRQDIAEKYNVHAKDIIEQIHSDYVEVELGLSEAINSLKALEASRIRNSTEIGSEETGYKISKVEANTENDYISKINNGEKISLTFNHKARYNNDRDIEIYGRMQPGDQSDSPRIADIMPYKNRNHMFKDKYFKLRPNLPCKTITAHMKFDCNMYIHPFQARGLTPREAARIQSYPDNYFFLGAYTKTYQQIGNSVPPMMARVIANKIKEFV